MLKTAIVTDSTAYLPKDVRERYNIHMIPLQVTFSLESFEEEQELTVTEFYRRTALELPKTSQPPIGEFINLFKRLSEDYDEIVTIHLSSGISGTYAGAIQAGEIAENAEVFAFDPEISCAMQGFYALKAAEMATNGINAKEIM